MREAVLAKFTQHDELRTLLLSTGDAKIVEHLRMTITGVTAETVAARTCSAEYSWKSARICVEAEPPNQSLQTDRGPCCVSESVPRSRGPRRLSFVVRLAGPSLQETAARPLAWCPAAGYAVQRARSAEQRTPRPVPHGGVSRGVRATARRAEPRDRLRSIHMRNLSHFSLK